MRKMDSSESKEGEEYMKKKTIAWAILAAAAAVVFAITFYQSTHMRVIDLLNCTDPDKITRISVVASGSTFSSLVTYVATDPGEIRAFCRSVGTYPVVLSGRGDTAEIPADGKEYDFAVMFQGRNELITLMSNGDWYRDGKKYVSSSAGDVEKVLLQVDGWQRSEQQAP